MKWKWIILFMISMFLVGCNFGNDGEELIINNKSVDISENHNQKTEISIVETETDISILPLILTPTPTPTPTSSIVPLVPSYLRFDSDNIIIDGLIFFVLANIAASAFHSLSIGAKLYVLIEDKSKEPLSVDEQKRLDNLLSSGKKFHNLSLLFSGALILISTLENIGEYTLPFGEIKLPNINTVIGLYFLVIIMIIISEKYFLMAFSWIRHDIRRPPYNWIIFGLKNEKEFHLGFLYYVPILLASIGTSIALEDEILTTIGFSTFIISGTVMVLSQKLFVYWNYLISERKDHRGGVATFSIYLLYQYRRVRQILYTIFILYSLFKILPKWNDYEVEPVLVILLGFFCILFLMRFIASSKKVYIWVDKIGVKFGFPLKSNHY